MTSPLRALEGLTITAVVELHGYLQLAFGDDVGVSIYNEVSISSDSMHIHELVGRTVSLVAEREDTIEIRLLDGVQITIDMRDQAFRGPEALELHLRGHPPVIWN